MSDRERNVKSVENRTLQFSSWVIAANWACQLALPEPPFSSVKWEEWAKWFSEMVPDGQRSHGSFKDLCYWVSFPWWRPLISMEIHQPIIPHAVLRPGEIMISSLPWQFYGFWVEGQLWECSGSLELGWKKVLSITEFLSVRPWD